MCKFRILRQCQVEALNLVDLQAQAVCGQSKDMPALRLISAEVMEVPARQVDAVYIGRTVDSNHTTTSIGKMELTLILCHFRQGGIRLFAGEAAAYMHGLEHAGCLNHIEDVLVAFHIGLQRILQRVNIRNVRQFLFRHIFIKLRNRTKGHAVFRLHHRNLTVGSRLIGHTVFENGFTIQAGISTNTGISMMEEILNGNRSVEIAQHKCV